MIASGAIILISGLKGLASPRPVHSNLSRYLHSVLRRMISSRCRQVGKFTLSNERRLTLAYALHLWSKSSRISNSDTKPLQCGMGSWAAESMDLSSDFHLAYDMQAMHAGRWFAMRCGVEHRDELTMGSSL